MRRERPLTEAPNQRRTLDPDDAARLLSLLDSPTYVPVGTEAAAHAAGLPPGYRIDRELGGGGGGRVYLAYRDTSDRPLALKIIHAPGELRGGPALAGPLGRAWRELELLESLRLPCVPRIVDYGVHAGRLYRAEEFVEGANLEAWAGGPPLRGLRARVGALGASARAVQTLHERGVIHRDLKPSNLLMTPGGQVMVVDFGLAMQAAGPALTLTEHGTPLGTPGFMAPEQARGELGAVSTRSDVYGLGATAYSLLTGSTPHDTHASLHEVIRRVACDEPRDPLTLRPDLPRPLAAVLARACERDPARRYESAAAFADDLDRWLAGRPVEAQPPTIVQRVVRWAGSHPRAATVAVCASIAFAVLAITAGLAWWGWFRPTGVTMLENRRGVAITSASSSIIRAWDTGQTNGIAGAVLVEHASGDRVLAVGFRHPESGTVETCLRVFDFEGGGKPRWSSDDPSRRPVMPAKVGTTSWNSYIVTAVRAVDVFDDVPGRELLVTHSNESYSGSWLRVYSLDGEVLSEAWHDGHLSDTEWIPDAAGAMGPGVPSGSARGLVVACGVNSERTYAQMGIQVDGPATHALVLFALRPPRGRCGWIATPTQPEPGGEGVVRAEWYRYLSPAKHASWVVGSQCTLARAGVGQAYPLRWRTNTMGRSSGEEKVDGLFWMVGPVGPAPSASPGDVYGRAAGTPPVGVWKWTERPE